MPDPTAEPVQAVMAALCTAAKMLEQRYNAYSSNAVCRRLFSRYEAIDEQCDTNEYAAFMEIAFRAVRDATDADTDRASASSHTQRLGLAQCTSVLKPLIFRRAVTRNDAANTTNDNDTYDRKTSDAVDVAMIVPCATLNQPDMLRVARYAEQIDQVAEIVAETFNKKPDDVKGRLVLLCAAIDKKDESRTALIDTYYNRTIHKNVTLELWFIDELQHVPIDALTVSKHCALDTLDEQSQVARDHYKGADIARAEPHNMPVMYAARDIVVRWHHFPRGSLVRIERRTLEEGGDSFSYVQIF